jgi:hypothetical protein
MLEYFANATTPMEDYSTIEEIVELDYVKADLYCLLTDSPRCTKEQWYDFAVASSIDSYNIEYIWNRYNLSASYDIIEAAFTALIDFEDVFVFRHYASAICADSNASDLSIKEAMFYLEISEGAIALATSIVNC